MEKNEDIKLTAAEEEFCSLYVCGGSKYAGQASKCYIEVFGEKVKYVSMAARRLLAKLHILARIKELVEELQQETETLATKLQVAETLKAVMEETSTAKYTDKFGIDLSPAPLRAVSVNAAKALMELYPIRHNQEAKLRIEGESGIVFNVIVPTTTDKPHED